MVIVSQHHAVLSAVVFSGVPIATFAVLWLYAGLIHLRLGRLAVAAGKVAMVAISAVTLVAYGWYERQMPPEMTIRIDLLILWPALGLDLLVTVLALCGVRVGAGAGARRPS